MSASIIASPGSGGNGASAIGSATDASSRRFERTTGHQKDPKCKLDVIKELENDAVKPVGGSRCNVDVQQLKRYTSYPVIASLAELNSLPDKLGRNEFGVMPLFMSAVVDATAQKGMFPMAMDFGNNFMLFGPKCHNERSFSEILKKSVRADSSAASKDDETQPKQSLNVEIKSTFDFTKLGLSRKFLRKCEVRVHFVVRQGEQSISDLHKALAMIRRQHAENWLCAPLRSCVQHMMLAPHNLPTTFYVLVVAQKGFPDDIIACDMGYVVGDIATAYTGAYEVDGAGSLTLGASAKTLQLLEIPIWDLGMQMEYKEHVLSSTTLRRKQWLQTVEDRKKSFASEVDAARSQPGALDGVQWFHLPNPEGDSCNAKCESLLLKDPRKQALFSALAAGVNAELLMGSNTAAELLSGIAAGGQLVPIDAVNDNATNDSKSQLKKAAKLAANVAKKELKKQNGGSLPPKPQAVEGN